MQGLQKGQFGKATFIAKKGWKHETICYGRIIDFDNKCIEFVDNDENEYIIQRSNFKFEPCDFKILTRKVENENNN